MFRNIALASLLGGVGFFSSLTVHAAAILPNQKARVPDQLTAEAEPFVFLPFTDDSADWWRAFGHQEDAPGLREALRNHYARLQANADLGSPVTPGLLVAEGLAVVRSNVADIPGEAGLPGEGSLANLLGLQREARLKRRGGWSSGPLRERYLFKHLSPNEARAFTISLPASATESLLESIGQRQTVAGEISRTGTSPSGHLIFLNFRGVPRQGFVGLVRRENIEAFKGTISGFPESLVGRSLEFTGTISEYRGTPQMELLDPAQIFIHPDGSADSSD